MVKVNDIVRFLNDVGGGRVSRIVDKTVYVEDEDGFEEEFDLNYMEFDRHVLVWVVGE